MVAGGSPLHPVPRRQGVVLHKERRNDRWQSVNELLPMVGAMSARCHHGAMFMGEAAALFIPIP